MPTFVPVRHDATYVDAQGVTIYYYAWKAAKPKGVIQLLHGLGEHANRYQKLARELVNAGYSVYADDHRGHGRTGMEQYNGDTSKLGRLGVGGMRATIAAIEQFTGIIRAENPEVPLVALGQSWGSLMLQSIINTSSQNYDGIVLTGTAYRTLTDMNSGDLNKNHKHLGTTGNEWLSRDESVHTAFSEDPLNFYAAASKLFGIREGLRLLGRPAKNIEHDIPVLIMIGSEDSLGGEKSIEKLARDYVERSKLTDVTAIVYPGARHEVFNETNRDEVVAELIEWLDSRLTS
ncbi:alpha-beta hydrolase superfamily lysophospholipase [Leifsonia sp. AK011]|uniref:alpha/beta hydrolase n=1 Tax=Leifsonia sp. AK011 TaxID=2723075 RepID=UPI0015CC2BBC|nr:alpha/beta hydrolase [Leifsonia sp. AK011]NYF09136.1 alpha-beta hydrolase superfamily lysophospholipase [Leifsonia sp. AK011]